MKRFISELFKLEENRTTPFTEGIAGVTTFMTMSYIIFVQPAVLSTCGMDFGAVMVATCISSAFATFLMGLLANYPIAVAPAMGHNFFFAFNVCGAIAAGGLGYPWEIALGAVFIAGTIFALLSVVGLREKVLEAIPQSIKCAIAAGIGLLIALVGLEWAGVVVAHPGTIVGLGDLKSRPVLLSIFGTLLIASLLVLKVRGAILWGILATVVAGLPLGLMKYSGVVSTPPSLSPTLYKLHLLDVFTKPQFFTVIFIFLLLGLFDTVGTLVGISERAGFMRNGKLPRASRAMLSDAVGTMGGALLGTSTVTAYIESAAGIAEGGKSGLANMITGLLLLVSLFFYPLARMVSGGYETASGAFLYPAIAPPLIIIGSMMLSCIQNICWDDPTESIPAFFTLIAMPVTFSITEGIAFGFISYSLLKLISGRGREVSWLIYFFSILFIYRYVTLG